MVTSATPSQQQHTPAPIPSVVPECSHISTLTVKFMLYQLPISLSVDTGACVILLGESINSALKHKFLDLPCELQQSNITLSSVQDLSLHITGFVPNSLYTPLKFSTFTCI